LIDDVNNDIRDVGIVNWRQEAQNRNGWRTANREAIILLGWRSHKRRIRRRRRRRKRRRRRRRRRRKKEERKKKKKEEEEKI
jgi:hypothetical protein